MIREKNVGYHNHGLKTFLLHPNLTLLDKNASYPAKGRRVRNTKTPTVRNARQFLLFLAPIQSRSSSSHAFT